MCLSIPPNGKARTALEYTCVWFFIAHQDAQKGCLSSSICTNNAKTITWFESEFEVTQENALAKCFRDFVSGYDDVANAFCSRKFESHDIKIDWSFHQIIALISLETRRATFRLTRALTGLVSSDVRLFSTDLVLLLFVNALLCQRTFAPQDGEVCIVARIFSDTCIMNFDNARDHSVEQPAIMADNDNRPREFVSKKIFKPSATFDVQVIRWFVEQQKIWFFKQQSRKSCTRSLPSRKFADQRRKLRVDKSKSVQNSIDLMIDGISTAAFEFRIKRRLPCE